MVLGMATLQSPTFPKPLGGSAWGRRHRPGVGGYDQPKHLPALPETAAKADIVVQNTTVKGGSDYFEMPFRDKTPDVLSGRLRRFSLNIFSNRVVDAELFCSLPSLLALKLLPVAHWSRNSDFPPFQMLHHVRERENRAASSCVLRKRLPSWGSSAAAADRGRLRVGPEPHRSSTCFANPSSYSCPCYFSHFFSVIFIHQLQKCVAGPYRRIRGCFPGLL